MSESLPEITRDWRRVKASELKTGDTIKGKGPIIGVPMPKGDRIGFRVGKTLVWYGKSDPVRAFVDLSPTAEPDA